MSELFDVQRIVAVANESNKTNNATQASKSSSLPGFFDLKKGYSLIH